jgi:hypothetical protein
MFIPQFVQGDPSHLKFGSSRTFPNQHIVVSHKTMFANAIPIPSHQCLVVGYGCIEIMGKIVKKLKIPLLFLHYMFLPNP